MNALEESLDLQLDFNRLGKFGEKNLHVVPVVLQNAETGEVLYVAYVTELALRETLKSGRAVLWSTSRNELWRKGDSSGDILDLVDVRINCEQNSLLYRVRPRKKGCCHTKDAAGQTRPTCYYRLVTLEGDTLRLQPA